MDIAPSRIERYFEKYEFTTPYMLCSSDCQSFTIKDILQLEKDSEEKFMDLYLGYTETRGNPNLRESIANLYETTKDEHVIVFAGAEEGVFCALNAILNSGDHYIVQHPNYQSLEGIPSSIGCKISQWKLSHSNNWQFDMDFLKKETTSATKAIALNNPHNPTGALMSRSEVDDVVSIAAKNDAYIFSDEVYKFSEYDAQDRLPSLCDLYEKGISLGVLSKSLGLPGLRIGWIATRDKAAFKKITQLKDFITICNSAPSEFLATIALNNLESIVERNLDIIHSNLSILDSFFDQFSDVIRWVRPKAGPITLAEITRKVDMDKFCETLRDQQGVLLIPGNIFEYDNQHFRLGYGRKNMPEALERFSDFLVKDFDLKL